MQTEINNFEFLANELLEITKFHSSNHIMLKNPAFLSLVKMGTEIVPLIIERYRNDPFIVWSLLLEQITGELPLQPISEDGFRKFDVFATQQAWLEWFECQV